MKKFFTLIAAAMMVAGANAQKEWNFSNWEQKTFTATETIDGLTVSASAEASVVIDGNNNSHRMFFKQQQRQNFELCSRYF